MTDKSCHGQGTHSVPGHDCDGLYLDLLAGLRQEQHYFCSTRTHSAICQAIQPAIEEIKATRNIKEVAAGGRA